MIIGFFAGLGVRAAGTVLGFQACLEIVTGFGTFCYGVVVRRADVRFAGGEAGGDDLAPFVPGDQQERHHSGGDRDHALVAAEEQDAALRIAQQ